MTPANAATPGTNYTIFAVGLLSNKSLTAVAVVDAPQRLPRRSRGSRGE